MTYKIWNGRRLQKYKLANKRLHFFFFPQQIERKNSVRSWIKWKERIVLEHALVTFFQNQTSLMGLTNQILQNVAYSVALFPVEPLTLCTTVKGRERSWRGQPRRRICRNMPKLWHPVEPCSTWLSADTMLRKSLQCVHAHTSRSSRLSHGKRTTQQSCSAAIGWEEDRVSQPTYTRWL